MWQSAGGVGLILLDLRFSILDQNLGECVHVLEGEDSGDSVYI